jgi:DNA polymerase-1
MAIKGLGLPIVAYTETGLPKADTQTIKLLIGNTDEDSIIMKHYKEKNDINSGKKILDGLKHWMEYKKIETLLNTFIIPLQEQTDSNHRVHCSLNINTETGRLSSRNPNLQNQPAYEKDKYKVRKAFIADVGKKFIVADYGQLELRVLAHMTNCKSMIEAFQLGGDFHSRTAASMYPHIKKAIQENKVCLEKGKGNETIPMVKDVYAAERRQAKAINFSIAYGKSAKSFARDWKCSMEEAEETVRRWFEDRKEVKEWQDKTKNIARTKGWTITLLGRYRNLVKHILSKGSNIGHGLRAAINTPIQGGAADIVIAAMTKVYSNKRLKELGWKILLQIHDELIIEGPEESTKEAYAIIKDCMEHPFEFEMRLKFEVDAKIASNWYEGK